MALIKRPFFHFYGAKFRAAKTYPAPLHDLIVEPFAGAAGYSCRYPNHRVVLFDKDPVLVGVWKYLIRATSREILALPDLDDGQTVHDLKLPQEARWLIGFWMDSGVSTPRPRPCKRMRAGTAPRKYWGPAVREHVARQVNYIRHWRAINLGYRDIPETGAQATWYVDPPYQQAGKHYRHSAGEIDFCHLADWCRSRLGQVVVCENTGANWLPFEHFANFSANARGGYNHSRTAEAIWLSSSC